MPKVRMYVYVCVCDRCVCSVIVTSAVKVKMLLHTHVIWNEILILKLCPDYYAQRGLFIVQIAINNTPLFQCVSHIISDVVLTG